MLTGLTAGGQSASYETIMRSDSTKASAGICTEAALSITGGHFINIGLKISRAAKDRPEYL